MTADSSTLRAPVRAPSDAGTPLPAPRVVHVVPALFGGEGGIVGGAERYAFELARHMADEVPTTLVTFADRPRRERHGRLEVRVLGPAWRVRGQHFNPLAWGLVPALLRADVIHCHQQHVVASSVSAALARLTGRRVFVSDLGGGGWDISGYVSTDRWYHGHLHISQYSRTLKGHAAEPRAQVIYGGVDTAKFSPDRSVPCTGRALFVGRLLPHKGVDYLIESLPEGVGLDVAGNPYDDAFARRLHELARGRDVRFLMGIDDAALVRAYRGASCVVLPSVYRASTGLETREPELLGQTLLEGMACGVPGVCTDVASMPEIVRDGETGFVVPPYDLATMGERLRRLSTDEALVRRLGARAREDVIERFRWRTVVAHCLRAYAGQAPAA